MGFDRKTDFHGYFPIKHNMLMGISKSPALKVQRFPPKRPSVARFAEVHRNLKAAALEAGG